MQNVVKQLLQTLPPRGVSRSALKVFLPLTALAALLLIHYRNLFTGPYVDDTSLIFSNSFIRNAGNPFRYWYRGQLDTKAWPLTHTAYWLLFQLFHEHYWAYRLLNLLVHWGIGALLFVSISTKRDQLAPAAFAALFFWFHPTSVDTVQWIAQTGTLLTALFLLGWIRAWRQRRPWEALAHLCGMLASKGFAFFLPFLSLRRRVTEVKPKQALLEHAPAFLVTAYAALLVVTGVYEGNQSTAAKPVLPPPAALSAPLTPPASALPAKPAKHAKGAKAARKMAVPKAARSAKGKKGGNKAAIAPVPPPAPTPAPPPKVEPPHVTPIDRVGLLGQSAVFYFFRLLSYSSFGGGALHSVGSAPVSPLFVALGFALIGFFLWCAWRRWYIPALAFALFLPVSGLFPAPYQYFYLVSDRLIYPVLVLFAWGVGKLYGRLENPRLRQAFWLWPLLMVAITCFVAQQPRADFSYLLPDAAGASPSAGANP